MTTRTQDFLFDDDDPKQRGQGCDAIKRNDSRLKFNWKWKASYLRDPADWSSTKVGGKTGQVSLTEIGGFTLEAVFWHTEYEATLNWYSDEILSRKGYKTRVSAQIGAESLLKSLKKIVSAAIRNDSLNATAEAL